MNRIILLTLIFLSSCATKLDPNSDKAFLDNLNQNVVWNQKIFKPSIFDRTYEVEKMFEDDEEAKQSFSEVNKIAKTEALVSWSFIGAGITYLLATNTENRSLPVYYGFLAASIIGGEYFRYQKTKKIDQTLKKYNKKKNYVIYPSIYSHDNNEQVSLNLMFEL